MSTTTIHGVNVPFVPVGGVGGPPERPPFNLPEGGSFKDVLNAEHGDLKFSKHAQERLEARSMTLNEVDKSQLQKAVNLAQQKGAQDSLVFLRDMAFIVSVKNRTVVTAIDKEHMQQNVFTNIDSAIVAS